ncbi:hypothetical protein BJX63DRAFT_399538 [Aspergillus granulosus]|uniref:Uncharacterized protein n=1 Tax=Aspergillus granulosus TaxID=176169 RepID=A0ABR4H773_9EURO
MKTTIVSSIIAAALALPLANAWTVDACGNIFTGTGSNICTPVSCEAGTLVDFDDGSTGRAIEFNLYSDARCDDEITHFASNVTDYVLPEAMNAFWILT